MSFSSEVKNEIAKTERTGNDGRACLSALILMCSSLSFSSRGLTIIVTVENAAVARTIYTLVKQRYGVEMSLSVKRKMNLNKNLVYGLRILSGAMDILKDLGIYSSRGLLEKPLLKITSNDSNARAYLAGAFMAGGSVNPPEKTNYHLEITANNEKHGDYLLELMARFGIRGRKIERRGHWIVYVKAAEKIADFLRVIGANEAVMNFENIRISRDFTNSLTRLNNCDVANEVKSQKAARKQMEDIQVLQDAGRLKHLDEKLQDTARIRLENPEASLLELCSIYQQESGTSVSKSGMKHRLVRLHEEAEKIRNA
jgi:DNA-binding protein WhiA